MPISDPLIILSGGSLVLASFNKFHLLRGEGKE